MAVQLVFRLNPPDDDWHLDDHTREVGRRGLADARRALAQSPSREAGDIPAHDDRPAAA